MGNKVTPSGMESMDEQLEKLHARIAKLQQNNADLRKLRDDYRRTFAAWAEVDEPTGLPRLEAMRCDNVALKQQVEVLAGSFDRQGVTVQNLKRDIETYQASLHRANAFSVDMKDMLHRVAFFLHTLFTARLDNVGYEERAKKLCELYERLPHPFEVQEIDPRNVTETVREIERGSWMAEQHSGLPTQTSVDMFSNSSETNEATGGGQPIIDLRHNDGHGDNTGSSQANIIDHSIARTNLVIPGVPVPTMATPASLRAPVANMTGTGSSTSNGGPRRTYSWLGNNNHTAPDWLSTGASRATNVRGNNAVTPANGVVPHGEAIPPPEVVVIEDDDEQGPPAAAADIIMAEAEEDTTIDDLFNAEWDNY
ncbi:MAG: hypothetical protein M1816_007464 [Peltula sp. TS41687]|nr:MAG: hypothetical protein M1816_007464 [Peltula sp. TS41687]